MISDFESLSGHGASAPPLALGLFPIEHATSCYNAMVKWSDARGIQITMMGLRMEPAPPLRFEKNAMGNLLESMGAVALVVHDIAMISDLRGDPEKEISKLILRGFRVVVIKERLDPWDKHWRQTAKLLERMDVAEADCGPDWSRLPQFRGLAKRIAKLRRDKSPEHIALTLAMTRAARDFRLRMHAGKS